MQHCVRRRSSFPARDACPFPNPILSAAAFRLTRAVRQESRPALKEEGQSLIELAVGIPFLIAIVVVLVEMGIVFASFISLINATREAAVFAAMYPQLADPSHDNDPFNCSSSTPGSCPTLWQEYQNRASAEIFVIPGEALRAGQLIDAHLLVIDRPITAGTTEPGDPITVTATYQLQTFLSTASLPYFGRFGLPSYYTLRYSMTAPIR